MEVNEESAYNVIDLSIKRLVRDNPSAFLELAGLKVPPNCVTFEDTAIQQRERRADHTCIITTETGVRRGVVYIEYQTNPGQAIMREWMWKWAGLLQRFPVPVVMLVVYMNQGNYATFHQEYRERLDGWETTVRFNAVRFWECASQIRTGKYPDFIPLLTLCEDEPGEATVREEVTLIQNAPLSEARKQELISLSLVVASRDVARGILIRIVQEVFTMKTLPPIMEDLFGDALRQRETQAEERGEERGEERAARRIVLRQCTKRLGDPSAEVLARLEAIHNIDALNELLDRLDEQPESWEQLLPPVSTDSTDQA